MESATDPLTEEAFDAARHWIVRIGQGDDPQSVIPDPLTPAIASAVAEVARAQAEAGHLESAAAVSSLAEFAHRRLGDESEALAARLHRHECDLARVEGAGPHRAIHEEFEHCSLLARQLGRDDLILRAEAYAGDCALYAAMATADPDERQALLRTALVHATCALRSRPAVPEPFYLAHGTSLMIAAVQELRGPRSDSAVHDELQTLRRHGAAALEHALADAPPLPLHPDREWQFHLAVAKLLLEHGSSVAAATHAEQALATAPTAGAWTSAAATLYSAAAEGIDPQISLRALARRTRERSEEYRAQTRSEAGRLVAGLQLDRWLGEALRAELMLAVWSGDALADDELARLAEAGEQLKARLLLDRLRDVPNRPLPTPELEAHARSLETEATRLAAPPIGGLVGEEMRLASLLAPIASAEPHQRLDELETLFAGHEAGFTGSADVVSVEALRDALEPGEELLDFFNPYDVYEPSSQGFCALLSRAEVVWPRIPPLLPTEGFGFTGRTSTDDAAPIDASPLGHQIVLLRMAIREGEEEAAESILGTLWQLLVEPAVEAGHPPERATRWVVAPHGVLHLVPWAALRSPRGDYLGDLVPVTVVPSGSVWHALLTRERAAGRRALLLGNPTLDLPAYGPLPDAEAEVGEVAALLATLEVEAHTGLDASEDVLRRRAPGAAIVHLATHGEFPEETALDLHRLLLARAADDDGAVHAGELRTVDLASARLVTLNVCNGGTIRFGAGDEPYGLVPALLAAGAENVVGTLWPISDSAGRAFAREFYARLLETDPARALAGAMRDRREAGAPIRDWAAYALTGPGRPLGLK